SALRRDQQGKMPFSRRNSTGGMMDVHWQSLIGNLAVVALFILTWVHGQFIFQGRPKIWRNAAMGVVMGLGAIASMVLATRIAPGVLFDLRMALVAMAGF